MARESAALVFLRTGRVVIWLVIDFTPDCTPDHTRDLTADLVRLRRADKARETGGSGEPAVLVFLGTESVFIWLVIDFTPDLTPGHIS